ncbi:retrotransposon protein, putative, ty1-copia subclass [Tanacetum coccineum]
MLAGLVLQGLRGKRKSKHGALTLYMGNGMRAAVEAIRSYDLVLPSGLIIVLDNCHFAPSITRGAVSILRLVNNGYIHTFTNYGISVSRDNEFYFNAIPRDGYPKEMIGYYFYYLLENKIFVARNAEFFENSLTLQKASGSHGSLKVSGSDIGLEIPQALDRYGFYVDVEEQELGDLNKPPNYKAALSDPKSDKWLEAMNTEMQSMKDNQVWYLVDLTPNGRTVGSKCLFKKKTDMDDNKHTFKARLVAKWYTQTYGVDYGETFSLVTNIRAIRILLAIAAFYDNEIWKMDVKTTFINGHLSEDVYIVQPDGIADSKHPNKFYTKNPDEPCVYLKASRSNVTFLVLYGNDILLMGNNITMLQEVKSWLCKYFSMKDLGETTYILGIKIIRDRSKRLIALSQSVYLEKTLKKFRMDNSKKGNTPMIEKPDRESNFLKHLVSRFQQNPGEYHWTAVKNILKYLRNTKDMVLVYKAKPEAELKVSCNADASFQTNTDDTKSQTRYVFILNGGAMDWKSAKQSTIAMSSTEAEYIAAAEASMEAVWMKKFIDGLGDVMPSNKRPMEMMCDNEPSIAMANDPKIMKGARHFQRKYHYIHEVIQDSEIILKKVHTYDNVADPFTKPMPYNKHYEHAMAIGICPSSSLM